ncbi:MAG: hypothetical protein ACAI38_11225 [Myxococcota bacterium]|nr:hypothetical protein [Myxococcota bacterium]
MIALLVASLLAQPDTTDVRPRIALAPLRAEGTAPGVAEAVASAVAERLSARGDYEVITDTEIAHLMKQEEQRQLAGCSSEKCIADLARIADAKESVSGSVSAVGERFIVALVRLDSASGAVRRRVQRETRTAEELVDAAAIAVDALWDESLPASDCIDCVAIEGKNLIAIKIGNDFQTFFESGLDVSVLAPGFDLEFARHITRNFSLTFSAGLSFGRGENEEQASGEDKVRFQVVPLNFGVRYDTWRPSKATLIYTGLGIGLGLVRTAFQGDSDLAAAFSAELNAGMLYAFARRWRFITELGYGLTTNTPSAVRDKPLNALKLAIGAGFVF